MSVRVDPLNGLLLVDAASTASLTLSGTQTVDGVSLTAGMLCLAKNQASVQAVYQVQGGAWVVVDPGLGFGLQVCVRGGAQAGSIFRCTTVDPVVWGTSTTTFVTVQGAGGTVSATSGTIGRVALLGPSGAASTGVVSLGVAQSGLGAVDGLAVLNERGGAVSIRTTAVSGTASSTADFVPFPLAVDATFDYAPDQGGMMIVCVPGATSAPQALIGFAANGQPTLNGVTPAGGISLTQDTASRLNIYAAGGKVRFQNKVGTSINVLVVAFKFVSV